MKALFTFLWAANSLLLMSCGESKQEKKGLTLKDCAQIAHKVAVNGDSIVVCDLTLAKDTFNIPLSSLLSSFEIIRLENSEEALTAADGRIAVSDNYISVNSFKANSSYKLYNKKGEYLSTLSSAGQGPDEYWIGIYDSKIDEINNKVYMLSARAPKILVFDFEGRPLKHIPLAFLTHKGRFIIHPEKEMLTMMCLPFIQTPTELIWEQDLKGNVLQSLPVTEQFVLPPDTYDKEVQESLNTDKMDYYLHFYDENLDTLYHYLSESNRLQPILTANRQGKSFTHEYTELPNHYLITWYTQNSWWVERPLFPRLLIEKESLRGSFVKIKFNMLGNIDGPTNISFSRGYLTAIMEPYALKEQLAQALSRPEQLTPEMRKKIKALDQSITDDDNCIVFIGKLKGS